MTEHHPGSTPDPVWGAPPQPQPPQSPQPYAQQYGAPPPAQQLTRQGYPPYPHPEPTPYHEMLRTWTYAPWKPILGVFLAFGAFFIGVAVVFIAIVAVASAFMSGPYLDTFLREADISSRIGPVQLLALNLGLGSLILVTWFLIRVLHGMRPRWLASVRPRLRWKFFAVCLGLAVIAVVAQVLVSLLLPSAAGDEVGGALNSMTRTLVLSGIVVALTTPLQAAAEEYLFRGYLLQAVGSLFRNRWIAIVATALLFALAHGAQNFPLFFDRFAFGLIAAWLVTETGGLEAGIALHVVNNFLALGLSLAYGDLLSTLMVSEIPWSNIVLTITQSAVFAGLVWWVARKMGVQTRTAPPVTAPERPFAGESATA